MEWTVHLGPSGEWAWTLLLPNGWVAGVADHAQDELPTAYLVYAGSQTEIVHGCVAVTSLADAKSLAIGFALEQTPKPMPIPEKRSRKSRAY